MYELAWHPCSEISYFRVVVVIDVNCDCFDYIC